MSNDPISLSAAIAAEDKLRDSRPPDPFDPRSEVSADAKYILKHLVLWFFVLPLVIGALVLVLSSMLR